MTPTSDPDPKPTFQPATETQPVTIDVPTLIAQLKNAAQAAPFHATLFLSAAAVIEAQAKWEVIALAWSEKMKASHEEMRKLVVEGVGGLQKQIDAIAKLSREIRRGLSDPW